jgi:hypothetical protein
MALCASVGAPARSLACAFDGVFDGSLGFVHPRSIEVALAIRNAVDDGLLAPTALAPLPQGASGLWQASEQLKRFGRKCASVSGRGQGALDIALLLSQAALWTRYGVTPNGCETLVHAKGPEPLDTVVVTDLAVLAALNDADLAMDAALARGLVIIDAIGATGEKTQALLADVFCKTAASTADTLADRSPWGAVASRPKP